MESILGGYNEIRGWKAYWEVIMRQKHIGRLSGNKRIESILEGEKVKSLMVVGSKASPLS